MTALTAPLRLFRGMVPERDGTDVDADKEVGAGIGAAILFFGAFLGWAAFAPLDGAVVAPGFIVVAGNRQAVQHRDGGAVSKVNVVEGQRVRQGDILIELASPEVIAQQQALVSQYAEMQMRQVQAEARIRGFARLAKPAEWATWTAEDQRIANTVYVRHVQEQDRAHTAIARQADPETIRQGYYDARIIGLQKQLASTYVAEQLLRDELAGVQTLADQKLAPLSRLRALQRALEDLTARRADLAAGISTEQEERIREERDVAARLSELSPQLASARVMLERTRIHAPVDGTVVGLKIHSPGAVVRPGENIMDVVPDKKELQIEAQLRPEDADNVWPGMKTEVRITAFSSRNVPILIGSVRDISADRLTDDRNGTPYFRMLVDVPAEQLRGLANASGARRLAPGLPAQVVAPTRKRTALQYLLEPLGQTFWRSFRET